MNGQKINYNIMQEFVGKLLPTIITVALTATVVWFITSSNQSNMPVDLKAKIDSLSQLDKQFAIQQRKLDSSIHVDEEYAKNLDTKIGSIKEKITIVREYYHEISQATSKYTPTQIDSFFKARYTY
jgi:hypothetical protein